MKKKKVEPYPKQVSEGYRMRGAVGDIRIYHRCHFQSRCSMCFRGYGCRKNPIADTMSDIIITAPGAILFLVPAILVILNKKRKNR